MQEQTNPRENKATIFEERGAPTAVVPFNNIQKAIFSAPACYSERSSKYLERRRGDETRVEQWDFGSVMASVHLAPPALCSVCRVMSMSPVGPPSLVESRWGLGDPPPPLPHPVSAYLTHTCSLSLSLSRPLSLSDTRTHTELFVPRADSRDRKGCCVAGLLKYFQNNL